MTTISDPNIIERRDGLDAYALYLDYIMYDASTGAVEQQFRYLLADNIVCKYARMAGSKRAAWNTYKCADHQAAIDMVQSAVQALPANVEQLHTPLLVELTDTDLAAMKKGEAPVARFAGTEAIVKACGKVDDAIWRPKGWI